MKKLEAESAAQGNNGAAGDDKSQIAMQQALNNAERIRREMEQLSRAQGPEKARTAINRAITGSSSVAIRVNRARDSSRAKVSRAARNKDRVSRVASKLIHPTGPRPARSRAAGRGDNRVAVNSRPADKGQGAAVVPMAAAMA